MMRRYKFVDDKFVDELSNNILHRNYKHPGDSIRDCLRLNILQLSEPVEYNMKGAA